MITETTLPDGPLLVVHAHPDDETLATGGLLATWAASGRDVTLVTCTRGERGEVIGAALAHLEGDGPALAAHRETELAAALAALGVHDHVFLDTVAAGRESGVDGAHGVVVSRGAAGAGAVGGAGTLSTPLGSRFEDSGMAWVGDGAAGTSGQAGAAADVPANALVQAPLDETAARLAAVLRDRRPAVVVTYEPGGGYGHPDHVRAHEITMRALALAAQGDDGSAHVPAHVWWVVVPAHVLSDARSRLSRRATDDPWFQALLETHPSAALPTGPLPAVAATPREVVATIDVRPVLTQVTDALRAHATQVHWVDTVAPDGETAGAGELLGWYALSNDVLVPWLAHEYYAEAETGTEAEAGPVVQPTVSEDR